MKNRMPHIRNIPLFAVAIGLSLFQLHCAQVIAPADQVSRDFQLPQHFEQRLPDAKTVYVTLGTTHLLPLELEYVGLDTVHDLRPFESLAIVDIAYPGLEAKPQPLFTNLSKTVHGVKAQHVLRLIAHDIEPGTEVELVGRTIFRDRFGPQEPIAEKNWSQKIIIQAYEPDETDIALDKQAALFYLQDSLSRYEAYLHEGIKVPWDVEALEKYVEKSDAINAARYMLLLRSRQRADEARRHLMVASNQTDANSDSIIPGMAASALQEIEQAFTLWKETGVPPPEEVEKSVELFASGKLLETVAPLVLTVEEEFLAKLTLHTPSKFWLIPEGKGFRWEGRIGQLGSSQSRTTVLLSALSAYGAILPWWSMDLHFPVVTMGSSTGKVWQGRLLNPSLTSVFRIFRGEHSQYKLGLGYGFDINMQNDLRMVQVLAADIGRWTNPQAHSLDVNNVFEFRWSQYTFAVKAGAETLFAQKAASGSGVTPSRFEQLSLLASYGVLTSIWVVPNAALQLDVEGVVYLTGPNNRHIGRAGIFGVYDTGEDIMVNLGVLLPYGSDARYSGPQLSVGFAYVDPGAFFQ